MDDLIVTDKVLTDKEVVPVENRCRVRIAFKLTEITTRIANARNDYDVIIEDQSSSGRLKGLAINQANDNMTAALNELHQFVTKLRDKKVRL